MRFERPSTAEQRDWLLNTPLRLRGVHFDPQDIYGAELLCSVRRHMDRRINCHALM